MSERAGSIWIAAVIALLTTGVVWSLFAPNELGGRTGYVIVTGSSMRPDMKTGDLAVVRRAGEYRVGDVAAYHDPRIGRIIHRIIGQSGDRFILQGDNNDWIDSYEPTSDEVIGKLWLHVPGAGSYLARLQTPWVMAIFAILMGMVMFGNSARAARDQNATRRAVGTSMSLLGERGQAMFMLLTILGVVTAVVAFSAFRTTAERQTTRPLGHEHLTTFGYSAPVPEGVYDSNAVRTGQSIFRELVDELHIDISYTIVHNQVEDASGTASIVASVSDSGGWQRTIELEPERSFSGSHVRADVLLDLNAVQAIVDQTRELTGVSRRDYILSVQALIEIDATIAGQEVQESTSPAIAFRLTEQELSPIELPSNGGATVNVVQAGMATAPTVESNTMSVFFLSVPVATARVVVVIVLVIALGGMLLLGLATLRILAGGEVGRINARYGDMIVALAMPMAPASKTIEVDTLEDLVRIAQGDGHIILHDATGGEDVYLVPEGDVTYRYRVIASDWPESPPRPGHHDGLTSRFTPLARDGADFGAGGAATGELPTAQFPTPATMSPHSVDHSETPAPRRARNGIRPLRPRGIA